MDGAVDADLEHHAIRAGGDPELLLTIDEEAADEVLPLAPWAARRTRTARQVRLQ